MAKRLVENIALSVIVAFTTYLVYLTGVCAFVYFNEISSPTWSDFETTHVSTDFGWVPKPNVQSSDILCESRTEFEYCHDSLGFKIPCGSPIDYKNPNKILFLGSSFTYGQYCPADSSFPYLTTNLLGDRFECLNGGVCGQGLVMQLIRAKQLIPLIKPSIVVIEVQNSGIERSQTHFLATWPTHLALPYYSQEIDGGLALNNPVYQLKFMTDINIQPGDSFTFSALIRTMWFGSLLQIRDHTQFVSYLFSEHPMPSSNRSRTLDYTFDEIGKLCVENGAKMVILTLSKVKELKELDNLVDGYSQLEFNLNSNEDFGTKYLITDGVPKQVVDNHFNASANFLIAESLAGYLRDDKHKIQ